jgi:general secretion pathway protein F
MPRFQYSALSEAGEIVSGELDGPDAGMVIAQLHARALLPIHAIERPADAAPSGLARLLRWRRAEARLTGQDLALFSQQLARLLKAGLPLDRALDILATIAGRRVGATVRRTLDRVRDGASLSEAMAAQRGGFPPAYVSMVRAGEAGGALHAVLARVADFLVRGEAMRQRVISAAIYPAILLTAAVLAVGLVFTVVLPQFEPMFRDAGARLPAGTRFVMAAGDVLQGWWWALLLALLAGALAWRQAMRRPDAAAWRDRLLLRLPVLGGLITRFEVGRFCRTLGVLLSGGVAAPRALSLCGAAVGNRAIAAAVETAATRFSQGEGLSAPLARTGRFPALSLQLIRIGEETGRLEEMLAEVADIYDQDVQRQLDRLLALLVPAITIGMGIVVALIVAAVMTAMISINDLAA